MSAPPSPFALSADISNYQPFTAVGDNEEEDNNNDNDGRDENLAQNIEVLTYQSNVGGWEQDASLPQGWRHRTSQNDPNVPQGWNTRNNTNNTEAVNVAQNN